MPLPDQFVEPRALQLFDDVFKLVRQHLDLARRGGQRDLRPYRSERIVSDRGLRARAADEPARKEPDGDAEMTRTRNEAALPPDGFHL